MKKKKPCSFMTTGILGLGQLRLAAKECKRNLVTDVDFKTTTGGNRFNNGANGENGENDK